MPDVHVLTWLSNITSSTPDNGEQPRNPSRRTRRSMGCGVPTIHPTTTRCTSRSMDSGVKQRYRTHHPAPVTMCWQQPACLSTHLRVVRRTASSTPPSTEGSSLRYDYESRGIHHRQISPSRDVRMGTSTATSLGTAHGTGARLTTVSTRSTPRASLTSTMVTPSGSPSLSQQVPCPRQSTSLTCNSGSPSSNKERTCKKE